MSKKTSPKKIAAAAPEFHWEFLRRKDKYNEHYKKFLILKKSGKADEEFEKLLFYVGHGLTGAVDPRKTYDQNLKVLKKDFFLPKPVSLTISPSKSKYILKGTFEVLLNFPKRTIMWNFEKQLVDLLNKHKKRMGRAQKGIRVRPKEYPMYLEVFDAWKKNQSIEKLAKELFPEDIERGNLNYAKTKIKRMLKRAQEFVEYAHGHIR